MQLHYYILSTPKQDVLVVVKDTLIVRIDRPYRYWCGKDVTLLKSRAAAHNWPLVRLKHKGRHRHDNGLKACLRARQRQGQGQ